ncbi:MAG: DUF1330 domain-containing protein, partial [Gammaproteobacteria bacterium]|nr:DUF1330 domain-containing protein [Gammaproteobacteria bacterium]
MAAGTIAVGSAVLAEQANAHEIDINAMGPTPEQMEQFLALPDGPIVMVNLLKFKPDGGAEEYGKYGEKIRPILESIGARILFSGEAKVCMIGAGDWDVVALVEYPNKTALVQMSQSEAYQAIHHHRAAGLEGQINYAVVESKVI